MPRLGVNIDHVATLRQARKIDYPDPLEVARLAIHAGADQIVCHLREDRRHIQDRDLLRLRSELNLALNLEMAATDEMLAIALKTRPDIVTLVPERRLELTTEGGLNLKQSFGFLKDFVHRLEQNAILVSLFVDPNLEAVEMAFQMGARAVELHTGIYAESKNLEELEKQFDALCMAASFAKSKGLKVFAGHGLNLNNLGLLLNISEIEEYNIGHSIIARAVYVGIQQAVKEIKQILGGNR